MHKSKPIVILVRPRIYLSDALEARLNAQASEELAAVRALTD